MFLFAGLVQDTPGLYNVIGIAISDSSILLSHLSSGLINHIHLAALLLFLQRLLCTKHAKVCCYICMLSFCVFFDN